MTKPGQKTVVFGDIRLDLARAELRRAGEAVRVEPRVFDLIVHFSAHPGEIQTREDLIDAVWGGRIVSDSAIGSCVNAARAALGDDGNAQRFIQTIPRRGFLFRGETAIAADLDPVLPDKELPDKPSIAVLPFQNMSGDPEQTYFSDGITADIITDLARYDELFVIARHSAFAYRGSTATPAEIARALGVQYVAVGSVRRSGNRIRVTAELIDPRVGNELWAERYDRDLTDIFEVQEEIASVIVNTLAGQIARQHFQRSYTKNEAAVNAYDHVLRALELTVRLNPETNLHARREAALALDLESGNARAHAVTSWTWVAEAANAWGEDPASALEHARDAALAAVAADDREPWAHAVLGWSYQWRDRAHDRALEELGRALSLNPGSAYFRSLRAFSMTYAGQPERALEQLDIANRLNPHQPALHRFFYGRALFCLRRFEEALPYLEQARTAMPGHSNALALLAACYSASARIAEARACVSELRAINSLYGLNHIRNVLPIALEEERDLLGTVLERAGLPE